MNTSPVKNINGIITRLDLEKNVGEELCEADSGL